MTVSCHGCDDGHGHHESWYERAIMPFVLHGACSLPPISRQRRRLAPRAEGVVLEVGMGTGINLDYYDPARIRRIIGVDPAPSLMKMAQRKARAKPFDVELHICGAEQTPLEDNSVDMALVTYSFCTIPQAGAALAEVRRVLRPGGRLLFSEHGVSDRALTARMQDMLDPLWTRLAGGCHLNRNMEELLLAGGFEIEELEKGRMKGVPGVLGFNYRGVARAG
jgi:SAM-dependent methyltransferase